MSGEEHLVREGCLLLPPDFVPGERFWGAAASLRHRNSNPSMHGQALEKHG